MEKARKNGRATDGKDGNTEDGTIFKDKKFILAAGSPFFGALFQHNSFSEN